MLPGTSRRPNGFLSATPAAKACAMTRPFNTTAAVLAATFLTFSAAVAQTPPPPIPPAAKTQAMPFLETAGMSDVYEITSSQIALQKSQNPRVRQYATTLIGHHTMTSNNALAAAKAGGIATPPPPVLNAQFRALISELNTTPAADFDRVYIAQQIPSHQGALELMTAYSQGGDVATLRDAAKGAVPYVQQHLDDAVQMQSAM